MELTLESGQVFANATEDDIRSSIEGEDFAILAQDPNTYIQCAEQNEEPYEYVLEYQDGSLDRHYHAVDEPITLERVTTAFLKYLRGDPSWRDDFQWEKIEMPVELPSSEALRDAQVLRKVAWRLLPFLCLLYVFNILDRSNVGFARDKMQVSLHMSDDAFNIGYGIFYFGYLMFEVPANLLLRRIGARLWIARIMVTWGLVSCATLLVTGSWSFYVVRILLGVAEAGFFPGIILYLTYWFPARQRARVMALFMAAIPWAGILGNPISGQIMERMHGVAELQGWQWLFLLEGIPSVLLGIVVLFYLKDRPEQATWLEASERAWLVERIAEEERHREGRHGADLGQALFDGRVWLLIGVYFTVAVGSNASGAYFPKMLRDKLPHWKDDEIGWLMALPSLCALVGMTLLAISSDRSGKRREHVAAAALLAAAGWGLCYFAQDPWTTLAGLCVAQTGMMAMLPTFWALPTSFLSGAAAAGGIALINSVANIGGLLGPTILGKGGPETVAGLLVAGGLLVLFVRHDTTLDRQQAA